jgi:hypothetical protein
MIAGENYARLDGPSHNIILINRGYPAGRKIAAGGRFYMTPEPGSEFPVKALHVPQLVGKSKGKLVEKGKEMPYAPHGMKIVHEADVDFLRHLAENNPDLIKQVRAEMEASKDADTVEPEVAQPVTPPKDPEVSREELDELVKAAQAED